VTNIESLVEAIVYANENGLNWWELFDSPSIANKVINSAKREKDEDNMICLLEAYDSNDIYELGTSQAYRDVLRKLSEELKTILN